ncbi:MAG: hypothetical protein MK002_03600 [Alphaproteobacteria bacterium]|nr:hypothetical protein [Alphaproteobacteria bacterium]
MEGEKLFTSAFVTAAFVAAAFVAAACVVSATCVVAATLVIACEKSVIIFKFFHFISKKKLNY